MTLTRLKVSLGKFLPEKAYDHLIGLWSFTGRPLVTALSEWKLRGFRETTIKEISFNGYSFKLILDPSNGFVDNYIYLGQVYEDYILEQIQLILPESGVFFDVGANIGLHSIYASKILETLHGQVYAFEPVPHLRNQLMASIRLNSLDNILVLPYACGSENTHSRIHYSPLNMGSSSLTPTTPESSSIPIEIRSLDSEFQHLDRLDLIKIDVEGYEYPVLMGASHLILKHRPTLLIEFSPSIYQQSDPTQSEKILSFLLPIYNVYDIDDGMKQVNDKLLYIKQFSSRKRSQTNLLCLPF